MKTFKNIQIKMYPSEITVKKRKKKTRKKVLSFSNNFASKILHYIQYKMHSNKGVVRSLLRFDVLN